MNQVTMLDRLFEPERFGPKPAAAPAHRPAARSAPRPAAPPAPAVEPAPAPAVVAMEPRPDPAPVSHSIAGGHRPAPPTAAADPEAGLRQTVRQHPWLTRFWSELSPAQQARVARHLPAAGDAPGAWDSMGLGDRARLVIEPVAEPDERRWASGR